jgi:uncharacterized protein YcbX
VADTVGTVVALRRYPVKSMIGEELAAAAVSDRGVEGDRAFAVVDLATGKVASAKNPRKWGRLLDCYASYANGGTARITLPDGAVVTTGGDDADRLLSELLGRDVTLAASPAAASVFETVWPELEGVVPAGEPVAYDGDETITDFPVSLAAPHGRFFDYAALHLVTTASLDRLHELHPSGRFEARRYRPNLVVAPVSGDAGFVENDWAERTLAIGDELRIRVTLPSPRCVMTTMAQGDLPKDHGILRAATHNLLEVGEYGRFPCVGVYADVLRHGTVRRGDPVRLDD